MTMGLGLISWWPWQDYKVTVNGYSRGVRRISKADAEDWWMDESERAWGADVRLWKRNVRTLLWDQQARL